MIVIIHCITYFATFQIFKKHPLNDSNQIKILTELSQGKFKDNISERTSFHVRNRGNSGIPLKKSVSFDFSIPNLTLCIFIFILIFFPAQYFQYFHPAQNILSLQLLSLPQSLIDYYDNHILSTLKMFTHR